MVRKHREEPNKTDFGVSAWGGRGAGSLAGTDRYRYTPPKYGQQRWLASSA